MTAAREEARLHPATVTAYSQGVIPDRRVRALETRPRTTQVRVRRMLAGVHPNVASIAYELSGGDCSRIEVVSPSEVVVHNRRRSGSDRESAPGGA